MKKKVLISVVFSAIFALCSVVCFAKTGENKTTMKGLGNEITSSINETEKSIDNLVDMDTIDHATESRSADNKTTRNSGDNIINGLENGVREFGNDVENTTNKAVAGVTGNYNAGETMDTNGTGMSTTTWIWIVLAVVAVVIIASVWYYASQRND